MQLPTNILTSPVGRQTPPHGDSKEKISKRRNIGEKQEIVGVNNKADKANKTDEADKSDEAKKADEADKADKADEAKARS